MSPEAAFSKGLVQVPEGRQLFGKMTVEENLRMGAFRRSDKDGIAESLEEAYRLFPILKERRRQLAGNMSGGEQQMCAMGRALMADPKLLMIDEMSLGLAPVIVDQLLEVLADIRGARRHRPARRAGRLRGFLRRRSRLCHGDGTDRARGSRQRDRRRSGGARSLSGRLEGVCASWKRERSPSLRL